jgi:hypothetical protein
MAGELILEDLEGNGGGLNELLSQHLLRGTEQNYEKSKSRWPVSHPKFANSAFRMNTYIVTPTPACPVSSS